MILLLVRHLETEMNALDLLQGRSDYAIDSGLVRPELVAANRTLISRCPPQAVYSSPLQRARATAILYGFPDHLVDERLLEFDFGQYEGRTRLDMLRDCGDVWIKRFSQTTFGEGYEALSSRVDSFIHEIESLHDVVLIFGHGVVIRYLISKYLLANPDLTNQMRIKNNQLCIILTR